MKSAPGIDYVDISSGKHADDIVDGAALQETSSATADPGLPESPVIVYALAPAIGPLGPLAVGTALVIQVAGTAVSLSGARSLWRRRYRGRHVYVLISILTCLCTLAALLAPAGF